MKLKLSKKQNEYILNSNKRWNLKIGAVRSGKSYVDVAYIIPRRLRERKNKPGLNVILGVSKETIERNVLQPMREIYTSGVVGTINSRNIAYICGVPVYCLGASKSNQVAMLQGMSIKYCYGDEIAKWNQGVFEMLKSRLDKPYSCFDGACNPESPKHWLKGFIDNDELNKYVQKYRLFDNPFLSKDYIEAICQEYKGTIYYTRLVEGEWALAEGLIYPMWENALINREIDLEKVSDFCISIDYGTLNAFAALLWAKIDNIWICIRVYYYSGRNTGKLKTDEEYKNDLMKWCTDIHNIVSAKKIRTIYGVTDGEKIEVIVDPSAASFIAELKKTTWFKVRKADNNVSDGIRETAVAMQIGKIKVLDYIQEFKDEVQGYVYGDDEMPVKIDDHCLTGDTLVMTEHGERPIKDLVGTVGRVWSFNVLTGEKELKLYKNCRLTREKAKILKITCKNGKKIRCTEDHLILTKRGWVMAKELTTNDKIIAIMD